MQGAYAFVYGCHGPFHELTGDCVLARLDDADAMQLFAGPAAGGGGPATWITSTNAAPGEILAADRLGTAVEARGQAARPRRWPAPVYARAPSPYEKGMRIGFYGLGRMGSGMARNLIAAGHDVTLYNRTIEKARALEKAGAKAAADPRGLAGADVVITMLADDAALEAAALEGEGLGPMFGPRTLHVSMSTVSVALVRRLGEAHARAGGALVSAPVFGRPEAAAAAKLFVVAAGPNAAVERCQPLFGAMGQKTIVVGEDPPLANVVKLAGNFLIAATIESMAEAFAFARKSGVGAEQVLEVLTGTLFTAPFQKNYAAMIARDQHDAGGGFGLELGLKDLRLVLAAADAARVPMPTASLVHDQFTTAVGRGLAALDWSALGRLVAQNAGL